NTPAQSVKPVGVDRRTNREIADRVGERSGDNPRRTNLEVLKVRFRAEHQTSKLPVVAKLPAAGESAVTQRSRARGAGSRQVLGDIIKTRPHPGTGKPRNHGITAPGTANVGTDVESCPTRRYGDRRLGIDRRRRRIAEFGSKS